MAATAFHWGAGYPPKFAKEGLTFDDVLLVPAESNVLPAEVSTRTRLTPKIELAVPIVSAAMDTVTESPLAIAMARHGGIGIVHRNLSIEDQVTEVDRVKRSQSGMITDPVTLPPDAPVSAALELMARYKISGVPIVDGNRKLVGLLTNRDLRFVEDHDQSIENVMRKAPLVTGPLGTTLDQAKEILWQHRIEKLPIVDDATGELRGLITVKDIKKQTEYPHSTQDERGRLRVGAAVGVGPDALERAEALVRVGVDLLVVDTSHGHNIGVLDGVKAIKGAFDVEVIGGNVVTAEAVDAMVAAGADGVKVGVGPGSICTTRVVAGVGVPQVTAIHDCAQATQRHGVTLVADGGIQLSGDIRKAIAAGADVVMLGSLARRRRRVTGRGRAPPGRALQGVPGHGLARRHEGPVVLEGPLLPGRRRRQRPARCPRASRVGSPTRARCPTCMFQLVGGLRQAMGYCGTPTVAELQERGSFVRITGAGLRESHPHDITITKEAPNYW